jgi:hypothetical protein
MARFALAANHFGPAGGGGAAFIFCPNFFSAFSSRNAHSAAAQLLFTGTISGAPHSFESVLTPQAAPEAAPGLSAAASVGHPGDPWKGVFME